MDVTYTCTMYLCTTFTLHLPKITCTWLLDPCKRYINNTCYHEHAHTIYSSRGIEF